MTDEGLPPPTAPDPAPDESRGGAGEATAWWQRRWWKLPVWAWIAIGVVVVGAAASAAGSDEDATDQEAAGEATDGGDEADDAVTATTDAEPTTVATTTTEPAPETTEATTTATSTTTTTSTSTTTTSTLPPVPEAVLSQWDDAGFAEELTPASYEVLLGVCDRYATDDEYAEAFWDVYDAEEATDRLAQLTIVCPTAADSVRAAEPVPIIADGVYLVGEEVPPGTYRVGRYWATLDAEQEIIDNDITGDCPTIMVLTEDATFVEISGEALLVEYLPTYSPFDNSCTDGTFLVGPDIAPGTYRVNPDEAGGTTYWARLDVGLDIIDNDLQEGQSIVTVNEGDFALQFSGTLEPIS